VCQAFAPHNPVEFLFVKSIADAIFEQQRLRCLRDADLAFGAARQARAMIEEALRGHIADRSERLAAADDIHARWRLGQHDAHKQVSSLLEGIGGIEALYGTAFREGIERQAKLDGMIRAR
jgi:hypothetical protein